MQPVPSDLDPALAGFLLDVANQLGELQNPLRPRPVCGLPVAKLPPANLYQNCIVFASDLNTLGVSDGTNWRRVDTGAVIA